MYVHCRPPRPPAAACSALQRVHVRAAPPGGAGIGCAWAPAGHWAAPAPPAPPACRSNARPCHVHLRPGGGSPVMQREAQAVPCMLHPHSNPCHASQMKAQSLQPPSPLDPRGANPIRSRLLTGPDAKGTRVHTQRKLAINDTEALPVSAATSARPCHARGKVGSISPARWYAASACEGHAGRTGHVCIVASHHIAPK